MGRRSGSRPPLHGARPARARRRSPSACCSSASAQPDAAERRRSSTASRGRGPRPRPWTPPWPSARARVDPAAADRGPARRAGPAPVAAAGSARPPATSTTSISNPPAGRRAAATWTGRRSIQRDDDRPETIRARLAGQLDALAEVVDYYREHGRRCGRSTAAGRSTRVTAQSDCADLARSCTSRRRRLTVVTRKSRGRDRARCAAPGGSSPRCWP